MGERSKMVLKQMDRIRREFTSCGCIEMHIINSSSWQMAESFWKEEIGLLRGGELGSSKNYFKTSFSEKIWNVLHLLEGSDTATWLCVFLVLSMRWCDALKKNGCYKGLERACTTVYYFDLRRQMINERSRPALSTTIITFLLVASWQRNTNFLSFSIRCPLHLPSVDGQYISWQ